MAVRLARDVHQSRRQEPLELGGDPFIHAGARWIGNHHVRPAELANNIFYPTNVSPSRGPSGLRFRHGTPIELHALHDSSSVYQLGCGFADAGIEIPDLSAGD